MPIANPNIKTKHVTITKTRKDLNQLYSSVGDFIYLYRDDECYEIILVNII